MPSEYTTPLRPHKVLGRTTADGDRHALMLTTGEFAGIIFSYDSVKFCEEEKDDSSVLRISFEYIVHETPSHIIEYDKCAFEKELGDFLIELTYYGLEREKLGFLDGET